jgi:hypothetical protein
MTTDQPTPDPLDNWIAASYGALIADLADSLDVTAGADEAMHSSHFTELATDLAESLDPTAGSASSSDRSIPMPSARPGPAR